MRRCREFILWVLREWIQSALVVHAKESISVDLIDSDLRESSSGLGGEAGLLEVRLEQHKQEY